MVTWNAHGTLLMHYCLNIPIQSHNWLENPPPDHQVSLPVSLVQVWLSWRKKAILRHYPDEQLALLVECYYSGALRVESYYPQLGFVLCHHYCCCCARRINFHPG